MKLPPTPHEADSDHRLAEINAHLQQNLPVGLRQALQKERRRLLAEAQATQKGSQV